LGSISLLFFVGGFWLFFFWRFFVFVFFMFGFLFCNFFFFFVFFFFFFFFFFFLWPFVSLSLRLGSPAVVSAQSRMLSFIGFLSVGFAPLRTRDTHSLHVFPQLVPHKSSRNPPNLISLKRSFSPLFYPPFLPLEDPPHEPNLEWHRYLLQLFSIHPS